MPGTPRDLPEPSGPIPTLAKGLFQDTLPLGLTLDPSEKQVLKALDGNGGLSLAEVAQLTGASDGREWMREFVAKLVGCGLDVIVCGEEEDGNPSFRLRRKLAPTP